MKGKKQQNRKNMQIEKKNLKQTQRSQKDNILKEYKMKR